MFPIFILLLNTCKTYIVLRFSKNHNHYFMIWWTEIHVVTFKIGFTNAKVKQKKNRPGYNKCRAELCHNFVDKINCPFF